MKLLLSAIIASTLLLAVSCGAKQNLNLKKVESITIDSKSKQLAVTLDLQIENSLHKNLHILEASAFILPEKSLKLTLANPLSILVKQDKVIVKLLVEGLNLFELPNLLTQKTIHVELEALVKFGNRKPKKIKLHLPVNTNHLLKNALKNQIHDN